MCFDGNDDDDFDDGIDDPYDILNTCTDTSSSSDKPPSKWWSVLNYAVFIGFIIWQFIKLFRGRL